MSCKWEKDVVQNIPALRLYMKTIDRSGQVKMFSNDDTPREVKNKGCVGVQI